MIDMDHGATASEAALIGHPGSAPIVTLLRNHAGVSEMPWQPDDDPRFVPATAELLDWIKSGLRLERPSGTKLYQLIEDWKSAKLARPAAAHDSGQNFDEHNARLLSPEHHVFVIEHDWASAFEGAEGFAFAPGSTYDFRTPYPDCCFEFQLSGKSVCLLTHFDETNFRVVAFVRLRETWLQPPMRWQEFRPLAEILDRQFRAVGIALEAEVASTEVVRAPLKLNRSRERRGRALVNDYHIVRLARRPRPLPLPVDSEEKRHVRLHFRRGHWRHFEQHRTWIKWTLVGDPDLGFIDKHYAL